MYIDSTWLINPICLGKSSDKNCEIHEQHFVVFSWLLRNQRRYVSRNLLHTKLEELHIATAQKPLIHQNELVVQYLHKISHACCSLCR